MNTPTRRSLLFAGVLLCAAGAYDLFLEFFYRAGLPGEAMPSGWWQQHALLVGAAAASAGIGSYAVFKFVPATLPHAPATALIALAFAVISHFVIPFAIGIGGVVAFIIWFFGGTVLICAATSATVKIHGIRRSWSRTG